MEPEVLQYNMNSHLRFAYKNTSSLRYCHHSVWAQSQRHLLVPYIMMSTICSVILWNKYHLLDNVLFNSTAGTWRSMTRLPKPRTAVLTRDAGRTQNAPQTLRALFCETSQVLLKLICEHWKPVVIMHWVASSRAASEPNVSLIPFDCLL